MDKKKIWIIIGVFIAICFMAYPFVKDNNLEESITNKNVIVTSTIKMTNLQTETSILYSESLNKKTTNQIQTSLKNKNIHKVKVKYKSSKLKLNDIPKYKVVKAPYVRVNGNKPTFTKKQIKKKSYQKYSNLDEYGRCGTAIASVGRDIMPKSKRTSIGSVYPSGWHTYMYSNVAGRYLYNRCHLIGHQLTGQNANAKNLITGTRYLNINGMLPFENEVADYVKSSNNHVMYKVTPLYKGKNLVASGVQMEGYSVEDKGKSLSFNVYCYNVQPGVKINYKDGTSRGKNIINNNSSSKSSKKYKTKYKNKNVKKTKSGIYILSKNTKKFHYSNCGYVNRIKPSNRIEFHGSRKTLINKGYSPCKGCNP